MATDRQPGVLTVSVVLAFIGGMVVALLLADLLTGRLPEARAQSTDVRMGARGLFALTGRITRDRDALFLIDTDSQTICVYDYDASNRRFALAAVRSFLYDRRLQDYNCEETTNPAAIKELVEKLKPAGEDS